MAYDESQWIQIKATLRDKLQKLQTYDMCNTFMPELKQFKELLDNERQERIADDQEMLDTLNEVCMKIFSKFQ